MVEVSEVQRLQENDPPVACGVRQHTIDSNGRFVIPSSLIEACGKSFYFTVNEENNIVLFPSQRFKELARCLKIKRSIEEKDNDVSRAIDRIFYFAEPVTADSNNRVQIPETLKEIVDVPSGTVHIVGALDRILLWPEEKFKKYRVQHLTRDDVIRKEGELLRLIPETLDVPAPTQSETGGER